MLIPDSVIAVAGDGTIEAVESHARRDAMCSVEFYSGILIPEMILPAVDWTGCGDVDFVLARLRSDGGRISDCGSSVAPFAMRRLAFAHTLDLFVERCGTALLDVLYAAAGAERGASAGFEVGVRSGAVLLTGADCSSLRLLPHACTVRIV